MVVGRAADVRRKETSYRGFLVVILLLIPVSGPHSPLASVTCTDTHLHRPTRVMVTIHLTCLADNTVRTPKFFAV